MMNIEKFKKKYLPIVQKFDCGNKTINNFIKNQSSALDENQGITYVLLSEEKDILIGFYNISVSRVDMIENINGKEYYTPMGGSVNINYLAVHNDYKKRKIAEVDGKNIYLSDYILHDCEKRILKLRKHIGISFITLYSTEEGYHLYNIRNDYEKFEDDMSTFIAESDRQCHKLYKIIDDII